MSVTLPRLLDRFARLRVLVIGDAMLDSYLEGSATRLCREAPAPIVAVSERWDTAGGASNAAVNARSLGAEVTLLAVVGDDPSADLLRRALIARGLPTEHLLVESARATLAKHRVVADGQILVRFDQGSTGSMAAGTEQALLARLAELFPRCDAVVVSDYGYGVCSPRVIEALRALQATAPRTVVVDARDLATYRDVGITAAKPNYAEAVRLLGERETTDPRARAEQMARAGDRLLDLTGARVCAVTLDTDGALVFERSTPAYRTYARATTPSRAAGAGDTFTSALALALAAGADTPAAAELASAAAAVVVSQRGTAVCSADDVRASLAADQKYVADWLEIAACARLYRAQGRRIVFTNGCFDLLHRGHVTYLSRAKALGDVLIVGLNSDASIARLKGPQRPVNTLEDRAQVLAALSCVDHIVAFDEDTPVELIRHVRPHVFAKGGDYTLERLPEAPLVEELGGEVCLLPLVEGHSTTSIIERIHGAATAASHGRPVNW